PEILEAYLNEVHLGQDGGRAIHGFGLASQFYFNKPLGELQPQEVALLIGLVKGPSFYNPRKHPDRAKERRDLVLGMMAEAGMLTSVEDGKVLALVGGREVRYAGFNRALDARRPIGSLAKPFVYLGALMQPDKYNLTTVLHDEPVEIESPPGTKWTPKNYDD